MKQFSIYGIWPNSLERDGRDWIANSAREAEDLMQKLASERGAPFWVAGVLDGLVPSLDRYAVFVDPDDPRNEDADTYEPDVPELEPVEYTVLGLIRQPENTHWNRTYHGQRWMKDVYALSPRAAEDVASSHARDEGGHLWVAAVLPAKTRRIDRYAHFVNPDVRPES